jgi:Ca2+-binding EF-hand superfamily protein
VLLAALVLVAAPPGRAQLALPESLAARDENQNGVIERGEAPIEMLGDFDGIDRDRDGRLDGFEIDEYQAARSKVSLEAPPQSEASPVRRSVRPPETLLDVVRALDRDGDGRLSLAEAPPGAREVFSSADTDQDGFIDESEARALDDRRAQSQIDSLSPGRRTLARTVTLMDTNGDGKLQKREAPLRLQRVFERLDTNGDGAIDNAEAVELDAAAVRGELP